MQKAARATRQKDWPAAGEAHVLLQGRGLYQVGLQLLRLLGLDVEWGLLEADQASRQGLLPSVHLLIAAALVDAVGTNLAELRVGVGGVVVLVVDVGHSITQAEEGEPSETLNKGCEWRLPPRHAPRSAEAAASGPLQARGLVQRRLLLPHPAATQAHQLMWAPMTCNAFARPLHPLCKCKLGSPPWRLPWWRLLRRAALASRRSRCSAAAYPLAAHTRSHLACLGFRTCQPQDHNQAAGQKHLAHSYANPKAVTS